MRVAVLGCGPAGLLACHGARLEGAQVDVYSTKVMSTVRGAQYLHAPIEDLTEAAPDGLLSYVKLGSSTGYADKVYGHPTAPVSWSTFDSGEHPAWSLGAAYMKLWRRYEGYIEQFTVKAVDVDQFVDEYDLVLSSIPAWSICKDPDRHTFPHQHVWLEPVSKVEMDNVIVYNGRPHDWWYRTSTVFGEGWTEYSAQQDVTPISPGVVDGHKPLHTDCDCHLGDGFVRVGRFGQWTKGILVHDAYTQAREAVKNAVH